MKVTRYGALAALLAIVGFLQAQSAKQQVSDHERLIGAWHLARIDALGRMGRQSLPSSLWEC